jgi:DNA helicase-2/ATP-dependent DNA helicase PcrA
MTIHAAKGLEFKCVVVGGIEETLFPNAMSINSREELEEESRLFYVAVTRAKEKLWLSYANARHRFGSLVQNEPTRFLEEMPDSLWDKTYAGGGARNNAVNGFNNGSAFARMQRGMGYSDVDAAEKKYGPPHAKKASRKPSNMPATPPPPKVV